MGKWVNHAMSAHDIYQYFATGRGTASLDDGQAATRIEWQLEDERAHLIRKQGELIRGGWQGAAAEGAFGAAQPLAVSALRGAVLLSRAEDLLDRQSGSFHRAANSVTPVPEEPPALDMSDPMVVFTDHDADVAAYQAQAQHNFDVYRGYDGASQYNETNMPADYATVNHSGGDISVVSGDGRRVGGDVIEVSEGGEPRSGEPGRPGGGPSQHPGLPQQTSPSTFVPPSVDRPGVAPPIPRQPTPGAGPGFVPGLPVGGGSPGGAGPGARGGDPTARGGRPGARGGDPATRGNGPGARGSGPGAPGGGPGARGGGPGGGPGGNAGPGGNTGARPGVLPGPATGAIAAEEAAARRAATATARAGAAGAVGGAPLGARGKSDEDEEHQRKVLIETDAESVFGSDELTAPQVIGDDAYED